MPTTSLPDGLTLRAGLARSGLELVEVWLRYVGLGGSATSSEVAQFVEAGDAIGDPSDALEHNLIAHALNEHFIEADQGTRVLYCELPSVET